MDISEVKVKKVANKQKVKRKDNPDYERKVVRTRDGVNQTIYRKKDKKPKRQVGTPQKRRGAFKAKATPVLDAPPSTASSMAQPVSNISAQKAAKNAVFQQDYLERLSVKTREMLQGEYKAPQQVAKIKKRNRANV